MCESYQYFLTNPYRWLTDCARCLSYQRIIRRITILAPSMQTVLGFVLFSPYNVFAFFLFTIFIWSGVVTCSFQVMDEVQWNPFKLHPLGTRQYMYVWFSGDSSFKGVIYIITKELINRDNWPCLVYRRY